MALIDYDDLRAVLSLEEVTEASYPALEYLMSSTESAIERYCRRSFSYSASTTEAIQISSPSRLIPLQKLPVESVSSITVDGTTLDQSAYRVIDAWGVKLYTLITDCDVSVVYAGGLKTSTAPKDLKKALTMQVAYEYQNIDHIGASLVRNEGGTVERPALSLLPEVKRLLNPFRHPMESRW